MNKVLAVLAVTAGLLVVPLVASAQTPPPSQANGCYPQSSLPAELGGGCYHADPKSAFDHSTSEPLPPANPDNGPSAGKVAAVVLGMIAFGVIVFILHRASSSPFDI